MTTEINNEIYHTLGDRWYTAFDDPVALLRAQSRLTGPWIHEILATQYPESGSCQVLDIGCGGGFLSNHLAKFGYRVTGIDLSEESLAVAEKHDSTKGVKYLKGDACHLPFPSEAFDVVTAMDFLEHVENPAAVIEEASRVLKPGGLFFFHTFNRNPLSWLVVIKLVEWSVKNTPKHMHLLRLFIKPSEMNTYCTTAHLKVQEILGTRPQLGKVKYLHNVLKGVVPEDLTFSFTQSLLLAYLGYAKKGC